MPGRTDYMSGGLYRSFCELAPSLFEEKFWKWGQAAGGHQE